MAMMRGRSMTTTSDDPELAQERLDLDMHHLRFCADSDYLNSIWPKIRKEYPDKYIAFFQRQVVASDPELDQVLVELKSNDLPANHIVIRYVSKTPRRMIL